MKFILFLTIIALLGGGVLWRSIVRPSRDLSLDVKITIDVSLVFFLGSLLFFFLPGVPWDRDRLIERAQRLFEGIQAVFPRDDPTLQSVQVTHSKQIGGVRIVAVYESAPDGYRIGQRTSRLKSLTGSQWTAERTLPNQVELFSPIELNDRIPRPYWDYDWEEDFVFALQKALMGTAIFQFAFGWALSRRIRRGGRASSWKADGALKALAPLFAGAILIVFVGTVLFRVGLRHSGTCSLTEKNFSAIKGELANELDVAKSEANNGVAEVECQTAIDNVIYRHTGKGEYFPLRDEISSFEPSKEFEPFDQFFPAFDDFYQWQGSILLQCLPEPNNAFLANVSFDLSFAPYCGLDEPKVAIVPPE